MIHANDNGRPISFISMFSGIEAASVAFGPLGWKPVCFAEIEKFPSAVLAHHYPDVPNVGDMSKHDWSQYAGKVDIVCGGPPCQDFSIAGLRAGLDGARGNLSITYMRALHAIKPRNAIVENVPGWLNDKKNAFGCFLAGLVGADDPLRTPDGKSWPNAGMVAGPLGRAAWRVLDAQYFALAQRRRRVIVVADFGNGADPAAVLFERKGLFGNSPPSREAGKDVAPTISARTKGGGGLGTDIDLDGGLRVHAVDVAPCLRAGGNKTGGDRPYGTDVDTADSLIAYAHEVVAFNAEAQADQLPGVGRDTDVNDGLTVSQRAAVAIAFTAKDYGADASEELSPTLRAGGFTGSHANGGGMPAVTVAIRGRDGGATAELGGEVATALRASQGDGDKPHVLAFTTEQTPKFSEECALTLTKQSPTGGGQIQSVLTYAPDVSGTIKSGSKNSGLPNGAEEADKMVVTSAVRRLTPMECERLQGFPDNYSRIPWRGKPADQCPDGPRYKALGNSWAVPKFVWLGKRIAQFMPKMTNEKPAAANDNDGVRDEKAA